MLHYIYIPGLGDQQTVGRQERIVKKWQSKDRGVLFIDARWHDKSEKYDEKFSRVCAEVKNYRENNNGKACVVGSSAGASMAINVFDELGLDAVVSIAGKLKGPERIGSGYRVSAPYFYDSVVMSEKRILGFDKTKISKVLTISPLFDEVVARKDMVIKGAKNVRLLVPTHFLGIGYTITLGARKIFNWFENLDRIDE